MSTLTTSSTDSRPGVMTAAPLLVVALVANLAVLGIATLRGAALTVDNAGTLMSVGPLEVTAASIVPLAIGIGAYALLAPRVAIVGRFWTPAIIVLTLLSLGGPLGASDLTTGLALGTMHLVVGGLAAFGVPTRLGR